MSDDLTTFVFQPSDFILFQFDHFCQIENLSYSTVKPSFLSVNFRDFWVAKLVRFVELEEVRPFLAKCFWCLYSPSFTEMSSF